MERSRSSDQGRFSLIKILDRGRKRFYRRRICDYPLTMDSLTPRWRQQGQRTPTDLPIQCLQW